MTKKKTMKNIKTPNKFNWGGDFKNAFKKGKWNDVDFLISNFTGYQLALAVKSSKRPAKEKTIYVDCKHKDRITELTNEGKRY